jgi:AAA domain
LYICGLNLFAMNIVMRIERKDANGVVYYTDLEGNRIEPVIEYNTEEQWFIDTTAGERAAYYLERQKVREEYLVEKDRWNRVLLLKEHFTPLPLNDHPLPPPKLGGGFAAELGGGSAAKLKRQPLWGNYWAERELCVLAGDTGAGKTTLALQVAKHLAGGCVLGDEDNVGKPRQVLYVDFELDSEGFYARYGDDADTLLNLHWAGYNRNSRMPNQKGDICEWMLDNLKEYIKQTNAEVLIIDQPDRLHINPALWKKLLDMLHVFVREQKLAVMLVLNTKPRNYARPLELNHIYQHKTLALVADSIVAVAADYNNHYNRYIKQFKNRNRALILNAPKEVFSIENDEETNSIILQFFATAPREEEDMLMPSKSRKREQKVLLAETMREDGLSYSRIANELELPVATVTRWVSAVEVKPHPHHMEPPLVMGWEEGAEVEIRNEEESDN